MRILLVIPYFYPAESFGGPVKVAFDVGKELVRRGHEVVVFTSDAKDLEHRLDVERDEVAGMKIHYFRNLSMFFVKWSKFFVTPELTQRMKSDLKSFDIVHTHEYTTYQNIVVHNFASKYGVPYVLQAHGSIPKIGKQARKWVYDAFFGSNLLKHASKVIALSQVEAEQYTRAGVPIEKIAIIPNGIDLVEYADLPAKDSFKKKFNIPNEKKIVLYLGRLHKAKGIDFLIKAYAYVIKNTEFDNLVLVIAGPDDGYLLEAKKLVTRLKIDDRVFFTGPAFGMRKKEAYADASIVVSLDSLKEVVFLMVPLEAAACGTPVIVTKSNYVSSLIRKGDFGFSVEYGNIPELAEKLRQVADDEKTIRRMGLNGRRFVLKNFCWTDKIDRLESLYEDTIRSNRQTQSDVLVSAR